MEIVDDSFGVMKFLERITREKRAELIEMGVEVLDEPSVQTPDFKPVDMDDIFAGLGLIGNPWGR